MKRFITVILTITMLFAMAACNNGDTWKEQYNLGMRYLSEGNYEEAIIAFTAAIEIDPKQAPAYIGLADVFIQMGDYNKAMEILRTGLENIGEDQTILDKLIDLEESAADNSEISDFTGETLDLRNVDIEYTAEPSAFEGNRDAVGTMDIACNVHGPSNVRDVRIGSWFKDSPPTQDEIAESTRLMISAWKSEQDTTFELQDQQIPFWSNQGHPVYPDELGHTIYVLMIGVDENMDAVGYKIIQESVPE